MFEIYANDLQKAFDKFPFSRFFRIVNVGKWNCLALKFKDQHIGSIPEKIYSKTIPTYTTEVKIYGKEPYKIVNRNLFEILDLVGQYLKPHQVKMIYEELSK